MKEFLGGVDCPGGHIITCLLLLVIAVVFYKLQIPKAEDIVIFALATMGRSMLGKNGKGAGVDPDKPE